MTTAILIIDPQNDFMDNSVHPGSLAVPGAMADMARLAQYIQQNTPDSIFVTMDSHSEYDISHPMWWINKEGKAPSPFTIISVEDVINGVWKAKDSQEQEYSEYYVKELAQKNKYPLCIWPYHCIEGTKGHEVEATLSQAIKDWEVKTGHTTQYIYKGRNPRTEHYSGLKAEVEISSDKETQLNMTVIEQLDSFDNVLIAGEAQSHCVSSTTMDLLDNIQNPHKVTLLTDCMSSVPGFEKNGEDFLQLAQSKGAQLAKTAKNQMKI